MKRILLLFALSCLATCDDKKSDEDMSLEDIKKLSSNGSKDLLMIVQALVSEVYDSDKLGTIQELVSSFKEDKDTANVTLIASQNVYNDDGTLKEIRSIELSIPNTAESSVISLNLKDTDSNSGFDSDDLDQLREARDTFKTFSMLGIDMDLIYAETDDEENYDAVYISKNFMALQISDLIFINQTIELDSQEEVDKNIRKHIQDHSSNIEKSILVYDKDGKYLKEKSNIVPELMSSISDVSGEVDDNLLQISLDALSHAVLESEQNYRDVPEKVRKALTALYPEIFFIVSEETPASTYMSNDFTINLQYDLLDLEDAMSYTIYGYNRTSSSK